MAEDKLLTVDEAAALIRANPESIRRWLRQGRLRGVRLGGTKLGWRIRQSELERFVSGGDDGAGQELSGRSE